MASSFRAQPADGSSVHPGRSRTAHPRLKPPPAFARLSEVPGSALLSRLAGWLAIFAMAANLCVGMAAAGHGIESPAEAPSCCCGDGCACGPACACSVAPADPDEHLPETPAPSVNAAKPIPLAMTTDRTMPLASPATRTGATSPPCSAGVPACGQRETRLRTGICTT